MALKRTTGMRPKLRQFRHVVGLTRDERCSLAGRDDVPAWPCRALSNGQVRLDRARQRLRSRLDRCSSRGALLISGTKSRPTPATCLAMVLLAVGGYSLNVAAASHPRPRITPGDAIGEALKPVLHDALPWLAGLAIVLVAAFVVLGLVLGGIEGLKAIGNRLSGKTRLKRDRERERQERKREEYGELNPFGDAIMAYFHPPFVHSYVSHGMDRLHKIQHRFGCSPPVADYERNSWDPFSPYNFGDPTLLDQEGPTGTMAGRQLQELLYGESLDPQLAASVPTAKANTVRAGRGRYSFSSTPCDICAAVSTHQDVPAFVRLIIAQSICQKAATCHDPREHEASLAQPARQTISELARDSLTPPMVRLAAAEQLTQPRQDSACQSYTQIIFDMAETPSTPPMARIAAAEWAWHNEDDEAAKPYCRIIEAMAADTQCLPLARLAAARWVWEHGTLDASLSSRRLLREMALDSQVPPLVRLLAAASFNEQQTALGLARDPHVAPTMRMVAACWVRDNCGIPYPITATITKRQLRQAGLIWKDIARRLTEGALACAGSQPSELELKNPGGEVIAAFSSALRDDFQGFWALLPNAYRCACEAAQIVEELSRDPALRVFAMTRAASLEQHGITLPGACKFDLVALAITTDESALGTEAAFDSKRRLCPDEACTGVIGSDNKCSVCGRWSCG